MPIWILVGGREDHSCALWHALSIVAPANAFNSRVVDDRMREVETGQVSQIVARGPMIMLSYWNQPALTAETVVDGWLKTGDAGYLDTDGYLYLVDRVKDMIVSGGENVCSAEVKNAVMRHQDVVQCAVIGVPDDRWGERVHAILISAKRSHGHGEGLDRSLRAAHR